uniref:LAGLIDADG endonuclease n=1 Tax=Chrysoporthe deuterocubensis TaxID=764597 RepID=A0A191MX22_9PEZI|nr:LAGLIDADG endonuclease [Chrysoporthe deuterocubensis]AMX22202.1 LAGLIDADG endonuclease [Chrysoporthe deuterocubensis]
MNNKLLNGQILNSSTISNISPWFVTGFADGEASFMLWVRKSDRVKTGWQVSGVFFIHLHAKDLLLLQGIQAFFGGVGAIHKGSEKSYKYTVSAIKELDVIIAHFSEYPLATQKLGDFLLFKQGVEIIKSGRHTTPEGLLEIVSIKASLNLGLSEVLKKAFPETVGVIRSVSRAIGSTKGMTDTNAEWVQPENKLLNFDPNWVAGFVTAEGSFIVVLTKSARYNTGYQISVAFKISQKLRDLELLQSFVSYFGCGNSYVITDRDMCEFTCQKFSDNIAKIIPFFRQHPILGFKSLDFNDWCEVAALIENKSHLTEDGLQRIRDIKAGMNLARNS